MEGREGKGEVGGGWLRSSRCCQMAEIPAKKLKRDWRKKKLAGRICCRKLAELFPEFAELFSCTGQKIPEREKDKSEFFPR
jgi:hypothetical protein